MASPFDNLRGVEGEDNIMQWNKIGDTLEGTYIGKKESMKTKYGMNHAFKVKCEDGTIKLVFGKPSINDQMNLVLPGQLVRFKFEKEVPSKKGNAFKDVKVYADPNVVDKEWLEQNKEEESDEEKGLDEAFDEAIEVGADK